MYLGVISLIAIDLHTQQIKKGKSSLLSSITLALGSIMVGVEQLELSSPWSKLPEQHPASFNSSFSTFSCSFSVFLPKAVKCRGFTGETEPSRGKERLGRECLRL